MSNDIANKLKQAYGSLAKLATKCAMDRTTLYRILKGTYTGDISPHVEKINAQLKADGHSFLLEVDSLSRINIPRSVPTRIDALKGTVSMLSNHCPEHLQAMLELVTFELEDICQICEQ